MKQYLEQLSYVLSQGELSDNRTEVDTIRTFGNQIEFDLVEGFPAITTKKLAWKAVVSELLWFLEGSGDERRLAEIRYNDSRDNLQDKTTIWTANATADYWTDSGLQESPNDLGRIYGVQWRSWRTPQKATIDYQTDPTSPRIIWEEVDQVQTIIDTIKTDPTSRRLILTAWNPGELNQMALPPCHLLAQFNVRGEFLDCKMYQRSADLPLGVPFNIASYALLTHMIAHVTGLRAGRFIHTFGDLHIYKNQIDGVKEQLTRDPYPLPTLWLNPDIKNIDDFTMDDIRLEGYKCHPNINFPFTV